MPTKPERERNVFRQFAKSAGLARADGNVSSEDPPHPDILYSLPDGDLAFELVELIDRSVAQRRAIMFAMLTELPRAFKDQPDTIQAQINERFPDAQIFINFRNSAGKFKRRALYAEIFECVAGNAIDDRGDLAVSGSISDVIERISIYRSEHFDGPQFDTCSAGNVSDPSIELLSKKLDEKSYKANSPISLLAYVDSHPMLPDDVWLPGVIEYLEGRNDLGPFAELWIYDLRSSEVKLHWDVDTTVSDAE